MQVYIIVIFCVCLLLQTATAEFLIGTGKADATGPASKSIAMGYSRPSQTIDGIHTRLWARAFLIGDSSRPEKRIMFVVLEACMTSQAVYVEVIKKLKREYNGMYTEANVAIASSHTHTGPGGYFGYFLYTLAAGAFDYDCFSSHLNGILKAIRMAHNSAQLGSVRLIKDELSDAGINRSPSAYQNNPHEERNQYKDIIDKTMTLLRFNSADGTDLGILNWFPVHCTSLHNTVTLISGDNKGVASRLFEQSHKQNGFIAAFAQANSGDVSPNIKGAFCNDTGLPCDEATSTCDGRSQLCLGRGPGWPDDFLSSFLIGQKQFQKAENLFHQANESDNLDPVLDYRSIYVDFSKISVPEDQNNSHTTCSPAMGYSFAAGTTDGPGAFDFFQAATSSSPFWGVLSSIVSRPSRAQKECQAPKPILLNTGELNKPAPWQPKILPIQILRIGKLMILCFPGEITTMAGRRLRNSVKKAIEEHIPDVEVVISGLTNTYSSYVTTYEEYQIQRYEGASTIFGPLTLAAYQQEFVKLAEDMMKGKVRENAVLPPDFSDKLKPPLFTISTDHVPLGRKFGDLYQDISTTCFHLGETVVVEFWSSNPRNCLRFENHAYMVIEKKDLGTDKWNPVLTEDDLSTKITWRHYGIRLLGYKIAQVSWNIPDEVSSIGQYRILHSGCLHHSGLFSRSRQYQKHSSMFFVKLSCSETHLQPTIVY